MKNAPRSDPRLFPHLPHRVSRRGIPGISSGFCPEGSPRSCPLPPAPWAQAPLRSATSARGIGGSCGAPSPCPSSSRPEGGAVRASRCRSLRREAGPAGLPGFQQRERRGRGEGPGTRAAASPVSLPSPPSASVRPPSQPFPSLRTSSSSSCKIMAPLSLLPHRLRCPTPTSLGLWPPRPLPLFTVGPN